MSDGHPHRHDMREARSGSKAHGCRCPSARSSRRRHPIGEAIVWPMHHRGAVVISCFVPGGGGVTSLPTAYPPGLSLDINRIFSAQRYYAPMSIAPHESVFDAPRLRREQARVRIGLVIMRSSSTRSAASRRQPFRPRIPSLQVLERRFSQCNRHHSAPANDDRVLARAGELHRLCVLRHLGHARRRLGRSRPRGPARSSTARW